MEERGREKVEEFCVRDADGAHAVSVWAKGGDGLVLDAAEFRLSDWGPEIADGVLEWISGCPATSYELRAMRLTGERCGGDECYETTATAEVS